MSERPVFGTVSFYEAMGEALNADDVWLDKAADVTATMIYTYEPPVDKHFLMRYENGKVVEVREAASAKDADPDFVLSASPDTWRAIMSKKTKPATAMLSRKLKVRGDQAYLMKNMGVFGRIIDVMTTVDSDG
jgi:putative sterol carrier protein